MKSFIIACILGVTSCSAFAGDCPCVSSVNAVVTKTIEVTTSTVAVPVRVVVGIRGRVAARRASRQAVRAAAAAAVCSSCN